MQYLSYKSLIKRRINKCQRIKKNNQAQYQILNFLDTQPIDIFILSFCNRHLIRDYITMPNSGQTVRVGILPYLYHSLTYYYQTKLRLLCNALLDN